MTDKIKFLSNLNKVLTLLEKEIIERVIVCLETGEKELKDKYAFTTDYEVEAKVAYYLKKGN
ncbi:MAG: hypothetical protein ABI199_04400 [Bacteroidia bacterium]